jgi:exodeoxyribonuclease V alpha subunit
MMFNAPHDASHAELREIRDTLAAWTEAGWLRPLDWAFGRFLWTEAPDASPWLIMAATLASHQLGRGHVCLDLASTLKDPALALSMPPEGVDPAADESLMPPPLPQKVFARVTLDRWREALNHPTLTSAGEGSAPLVAVGNRLYLRRFWACEQEVLGQIQHRLQHGLSRTVSPDSDGISHTLEGLFPAAEGLPLDWQKLACALAARSLFSIMTGGPGTGKTTTVLKVLALLQSLALSSNQAPRALRIKLAAPTGKAAARLSQSIASRVEGLDLSRLAHAEAVRAAIPRSVTTLHRLLGSRPDTRHFRHDARNPLGLDVLVIDEASMIDLEMMAAVLRALPADARLILLGDKDQLASVEAGAVLGELCRRAEQGHYMPVTRRWLEQTASLSIPDEMLDPEGTPLDQAVTMLRQSHRFSASSGIGQLARAVNAGQADTSLAILQARPSDLGHLIIREKQDTAFEALVLEGGVAADITEANDPSRVGYGHYLSLLRPEHRPGPTSRPDEWNAWAERVLKAHTRFQLLCAVRKGPWGVEGLNQRIEALLARRHYIDKQGDWYEGRPVLVTRNDYALGLMNGDIGVTLAVQDPDRKEPTLRVAFPAHNGKAPIQWVTPTRLNGVETVFALTVHKSQGSEFTHTALVLPNRPNPVLTRELLYTGITRASHWFTLANAGDSKTLRQAIERHVLRNSGLDAGPG